MRNKAGETHPCFSLLPAESFQSTGQMGEVQAEPSILFELRIQTWESKKSREPEFIGQSTREGRTYQREKTLKPCRGSLTNIQITDQGMCVRKMPRPGGKKHPNKLEELG